MMKSATTRLSGLLILGALALAANMAAVVTGVWDGDEPRWLAADQRIEQASEPLRAMPEPDATARIAWTPTER